MNEVHLFYESDKSVYYYNKYSKHHEYLEEIDSIQQVSSELIYFEGAKGITSLRSFDNRIVSENVQHELIKIDSPTRSYFGFIQAQSIIFIRDKKSVVYEFTSDNFDDKIDYIYRLNNKLHVFFNQGKGIWTLKPKPKQFDQDT